MSSAQLAESQRVEKRKRMKCALESGLTLQLSQDTQQWNATESTALTSPLEVTAKLDHQYTIPFPTNASAPQPRGLVCPTHKANSKPFVRVDAAKPSAMLDPPRRRRNEPQLNDLGPGFSDAIAAMPFAGKIDAVPANKRAPNVFQGTTSADAFFTDQRNTIAQPERTFRPFQATDRSYVSQW
eukprot:m.417026 g.417026  ORF g.417026 m.417026 type:complete len:183 (+) comp30231_c0_seq1:165-713(+)